PERELTLDPAAGFTRVAAGEKANRLLTVAERARERRAKPADGWRVEWISAGFSANSVRAKQTTHDSPREPKRFAPHYPVTNGSGLLLPRARGGRRRRALVQRC